ncbi:MAG TPA: hypothetical protein VGF47_05045 [Solirubrobacteraceae bacterium]
MLAYLSWHRPAAGVERQRYEQALEHFHRSLAHRPPSGFHGSATVRLPELPWLAPVAGSEPDLDPDAPVGPHAPGGPGQPGYEDWYLIDDWAAVGVLEEAAVSHGHVTTHDAAAKQAGAATGAVYRLVEGCPRLDAVSAVWVERKPGRPQPSLATLLGDGMDPQRGGLWRRCIGLGPAPEYCLLASEPPAGIGAERLPEGWIANALARETIWSG